MTVEKVDLFLILLPRKHCGDAIKRRCRITRTRRNIYLYAAFEFRMENSLYRRLYRFVCSLWCANYQQLLNLRRVVYVYFFGFYIYNFSMFTCITGNFIQDTHNKLTI